MVSQSINVFTYMAIRKKYWFSRDSQSMVQAQGLLLSGRAYSAIMRNLVTIAHFATTKMVMSPVCSERHSKSYPETIASNLQILAALVTLTATPAQAQQLIQCPDWRSLVKQVKPVVLAKSSLKTPFNVAVLQENLKPLSHKDPVTPTSKMRGSSTKVSAAPTSTAGCPTYKVKAGDTLAGIAQNMLGSSKRHPELLAANAGTVKSARFLKVGTTLIIPCALPKLTPKPLPKRAGRLFRKSKTAVLLAPTAVAEAKPLPVWHAKSGEYLSDVIKRWGKAAGYTVIVGDGAEWRLGVPVRETETFENTLAKLIKGFAANGQPPAVRVFSNKVIKIGAIR